MKKTNLFSAFLAVVASLAVVMPAAADVTVVKKVVPKYPTFAEKQEIEGSVELAFVILKDGSVDAIEVVNSTSPELFDASAVEAISQWQFEKSDTDENVGVTVNFEF